MSFFTEPTGYEKTILSDLQGAWQVLRQEIIDSENMGCLEKMLFHIDEATSWETVRHLETIETDDNAYSKYSCSKQRIRWNYGLYCRYQRNP